MVVVNVYRHFILDGFACSTVLTGVALVRWPQWLIQPREAAAVMAGLIPGQGRNE